MNIPLFNQFIISEDSLWIYDGDRLVFKSDKDGLQPLLEYIDRFVPYPGKVKIFDKIMGNAAALLLKKALCLKVYSPVASQAAVHSLEKFGISYHFSKIVPCIQEGNDICPMEKLSGGKTPDEFYQAVKDLVLKEAGAK